MVLFISELLCHVRTKVIMRNAEQLLRTIYLHLRTSFLKSAVYGHLALDSCALSEKQGETIRVSLNSRKLE